MATLPVFSLKDFTAEIRPRVDEALDAYTRLGSACPARLCQSMRYSLLGPGKRLRPFLVLLASRACGGRMEDAMPAACAVEMIHCYSLVHDDLPAMDDDDLRRGRATNHKVFGEGQAILAGDALLTLAFEILARDVRPAETAVACIAALAEAAGATALVGGQADDLAADGNGPSDFDSLESIHHRKTGAMFLVSLRLGGLTAAASDHHMTALNDYGTHLGMAFQIMDDLLDVEGDESRVGKRVGKDAARGKLTFPGLLGVDESRRRATRLVADACGAIEPLGPAADGLAALARFVTERDN